MVSETVQLEYEMKNYRTNSSIELLGSKTLKFIAVCFSRRENDLEFSGFSQIKIGLKPRSMLHFIRWLKPTAMKMEAPVRKSFFIFYQPSFV